MWQTPSLQVQRKESLQLKLKENIRFYGKDERISKDQRPDLKPECDAWILWPLYAESSRDYRQLDMSADFATQVSNFSAQKTRKSLSKIAISLTEKQTVNLKSRLTYSKVKQLSSAEQAQWSIISGCQPISLDQQFIKENVDDAFAEVQRIKERKIPPTIPPSSPKNQPSSEPYKEIETLSLDKIGKFFLKR